MPRVVHVEQCFSERLCSGEQGTEQGASQGRRCDRGATRVKFQAGTRRVVVLTH